MDHLGHGNPPASSVVLVFCFTGFSASSENPKSSPQPGGTKIGGVVNGEIKAPAQLKRVSMKQRGLKDFKNEEGGNMSS